MCCLHNIPVIKPFFFLSQVPFRQRRPLPSTLYCKENKIYTFSNYNKNILHFFIYHIVVVTIALFFSSFFSKWKENGSLLQAILINIHCGIEFKSIFVQLANIEPA